MANDALGAASGANTVPLESAERVRAWRRAGTDQLCGPGIGS